MHYQKMKSNYSLLQIIIIILHYLQYPTCSSSFQCGETQIESPFLERMISCNSQKPYFRTSIGLFPVSSINYTTKLLTVLSHPSSHYVSPLLLVEGFPPAPSHSFIVVFNCSSKVNGNGSHFFSNGTHLAVDVEETGFDPKDLNCSKYYWAHQKSSDGGEGFDKYEVGIRVSFDVPAHVPNLCNECQKQDGHCGVGLKCICHPQQCRDQIVARTRSGSSRLLDLVFVTRFALIISLLIS